MTARYDLAKIKLGKLMTDPDAEGIILDVIPDLKASPTYLVARTLTASAASSSPKRRSAPRRHPNCVVASRRSRREGPRGEG